MSVERLWRWTCDACSKVEDRGDYGLPRGWIFVKGHTVTHRCPDCQADIPKHQAGHPAVVAER
jgi:hypothetical protein